MNKPDPKKPQGEVVAIAAVSLPAIKKSPNRWKMFRRLQAEAENIELEYERLGELRQELRIRQSNQPPPDDPVELSEYDKRSVARCRQWLTEIDRAEYYEFEDDDRKNEVPILTKKIISQRLALMLGAVHIGGPQTPEAFLTMLLEHVYDGEFSFLAMESGCRQIEQTEKYVQAISAVLKVFNEHQKQWRDWRRAIEFIEERAENLQKDMREAQAKFELEEAETKARRCRTTLGGLVSLLENYVTTDAIESQDAAREAYQKVEAAMAKLAEYRQKIDAAAAAAKEADDPLAKLKAAAEKIEGEQ